MTVTLENNNLTVSILEHGAELQSVYNKAADIEYIWGADPKYWGRHASNLFPIVGRLKGDQYKYKEETYYMNQHGFARNMDFSVVEQSKQSVVFRLVDTEATHRIYPFKFQFDIVYTLSEDDKLNVQYKVYNPDDIETLFFSCGGHPAFNLPLDGGQFKDYYISFSPEKHYKRERLVGPYLNLHNSTDMDTQIPLRMRHEDYYDDAIILNLQRQPISLLLARLANQHGLRFNIKNAQYVGIWTPRGKDAPFIAIEPWWGIADTVDATGDIENKFGINVLAAGDTFVGEYELHFF